MLVSVTLGHDTTKRMTGHDVIVTSETLFNKLLHSITYVVIDEDRFRSIKYEIREPNPDTLSLYGSLPLDFSRDGLVGGVVAIHSVDPDNSDISAVVSGGGHDYELCISDGG